MKIAVIPARFQVPVLHAGHTNLIATAIQECDFVIIILGETINSIRNKDNPFSVVERTNIIKKVFPQVAVRSIRDRESNTEWNEALENMLDRESFEGHELILYHGRDSFAKTYKGNLKTREVSEIPNFSGTKVRESYNYIYKTK